MNKFERKCDQLFQELLNLGTIICCKSSLININHTYVVKENFAVSIGKVFCSKLDSVKELHFRFYGKCRSHTNIQRRKSQHFEDHMG